MNLRFKHRGDEAEFVNCNGCSQATYDIGTRLNKNRWCESVEGWHCVGASFSLHEQAHIDQRMSDYVGQGHDGSKAHGFRFFDEDFLDFRG